MKKTTPCPKKASMDLYEEDILKAVNSLTDMSRRVFILYAIEGYTHAEIANQLGISEGTSKWHLSTARQKLRELLKSMGYSVSQKHKLA